MHYVPIPAFCYQYEHIVGHARKQQAQNTRMSTMRTEVKVKEG